MAIYLDDSINTNYYKYVYEFTDNSVAFSSQKTFNISSGDTFSFYVKRQYFNPPYVTSDYITVSGPFYRTCALASGSTFNFSNSIFDRADFPSIFICSVIILFIFGWILNQLTKIFYKGRCFWI